MFTVPPPISTSTTLYSVEELVTEVLIDSECNQAFNVTSSTGIDFGSTNGIGYCEANGSSWPFENGLIMTSGDVANACLLYTSPSPRDYAASRMPSSA